jgi:hypothetical protein
MNDLINPVWFFDGAVIMWIAVGLASIFLLALAFDMYQRRRKRKGKRGTIRSRLEDRHDPGFLHRMRLLFSSVKGEAARRRRHAERNREREEYLRGGGRK